MNNQQTLPFSVRVSKEDFLVKAKEAYEYYLSKTDIKNESSLKLEKQLINLYKMACDVSIGHNPSKYSKEREKIDKYSSNIDNYQYTQRVLHTIGMVSISSDEFVDVTEDIYKLIYKCDTNILLLHS